MRTVHDETRVVSDDGVGPRRPFGTGAMLAVLAVVLLLGLILVIAFAGGRNDTSDDEAPGGRDTTEVTTAPNATDDGTGETPSGETDTDAGVSNDTDANTSGGSSGGNVEP